MQKKKDVGIVNTVFGIQATKISKFKHKENISTNQNLWIKHSFTATQFLFLVSLPCTSFQLFTQKFLSQVYYHPSHLIMLKR